jgi:CheY-like chemotaxis protein
VCYHHRLSVLVVEDRLQDAYTLATLLRADGDHIRVVGDGQTALREMLAEPPDVVLLDLSLPKLDGFEVAAAVRRAHLPRRPWIVVVSGHNEPWVRARADAAGVDDFFAKPIDPAQLRASIRLLPPCPETNDDGPDRRIAREAGTSVVG